MTEPLWTISGMEWRIPPPGRFAVVQWTPGVGLTGTQWAIDEIREMAGETIALHPSGPFITVQPEHPGMSYWAAANLLRAYAATTGWENIPDVFGGDADLPDGAKA